MSQIRTIEVRVLTTRRKLLANLTLDNTGILKAGTLKIDGTINVASEALALLAEHSAALPFNPVPPRRANSAIISPISPLRPMKLPKDKHGWTASRLIKGIIKGIIKGMKEGIGFDELEATYSQLETSAELAKQMERDLCTDIGLITHYVAEKRQLIKASKEQDQKYRALARVVGDLKNAFEAIHEAHNTFFGQSCSNPICDSWQKPLNCTGLNEAMNNTAKIVQALGDCAGENKTPAIEPSVLRAIVRSFKKKDAPRGSRQPAHTESSRYDFVPYPWPVKPALLFLLGLPKNITRKEYEARWNEAVAPAKEAL